MLQIGVDLGGTKCAVSLGEIVDDQVKILHKCAPRPTKSVPAEKMLKLLSDDIRFCARRAEGIAGVCGIGVSCGGPLDSRAGLILSPPNLPGWNRVPVTDYFTEKTGLRAWLCNDADACALAEWKLGAGKGCSNMIFLTFGTGLGAGLILNGRLYKGSCDMAGEVGHIRLENWGPCGYGKAGSFEGFCSGGGIAQLAKLMVLEQLQSGKQPALCRGETGMEGVTAARVGEFAKAGDPLAREILRRVGVQLGKGLSILMDVLNPERIVIGSIFARCYDEIYPFAEQVIEREALPAVRKNCRVVPSMLSENVGDAAALMTAKYNYETELDHEGIQ
ncbi:ROK family protein [Caproicibacter sp.]|uniref:ROK family protein n=1 Tax=Caproicibacter sp. TaxID=2814884 RepID=UPI00398A2BD5